MKDKQIFKKWWFWVIVVVALSAIGAATQSGSDTNTTNTTDSSQVANNSSTGTLPTLKADDYKGKEGLVVYKELKNKGYTVNADFEKQALTDINGTASSVFEPLDPAKPADKQSVDAFVVGDLSQDGDTVKLTIVQSSNQTVLYQDYINNPVFLVAAIVETDPLKRPGAAHQIKAVSINEDDSA